MNWLQGKILDHRHTKAGTEREDQQSYTGVPELELWQFCHLRKIAKITLISIEMDILPIAKRKTQRIEAEAIRIPKYSIVSSSLQPN